MDPNGRFFLEKPEAPRSEVDRAEQGRAINQIGLGWSDQSKENNSRAELVDQR